MMWFEHGARLRIDRNLTNLFEIEFLMQVSFLSVCGNFFGEIFTKNKYN